MWRSGEIAIQEDYKPVNCSVSTAQPWVYGLGQQTANGVYLSPENAVVWLAEKLATLTERSDMVVFMVTGQSHDEFMARLDQLTEVFPAPAFKQVSRLARSAAELGTVKMQKPAKAVNSLPEPVLLSVPTIRAMASASAAARASEPGQLSLTGLKATLAEFTAQRAALLSGIADAAGELTGKSARAWVFTSTGSAAELARELLTDIPAVSSVYTAAIMLVGSDLSSIRGMIHDSHYDGA